MKQNDKTLIAVQVENEMLSNIDQYCELAKISRSEMLRLGINKILSSSPIDISEVLSAKDLQKKIDKAIKVLQDK